MVILKYLVEDMFFFFQAEDGIRDVAVTGVQTCALPISRKYFYDQAFHAAERAREIFTRLDDPRRLARLEINVGNIYHRQDRFEESIAHYEIGRASCRERV